MHDSDPPTDGTGPGKWMKLLQALGDSGLEFVVVGGAALVLHGIPRTTLDVDIYLSLSSLNLRLLNRVTEEYALECTHPELLNLPVEFLAGQWLSFKPLNGPAILDVYLSSPAKFNDLRQDAETIEVSDSSCLIASVHTLYEMKQNCGREIDQADLALIREYWQVLEEEAHKG